MPSALRHSSLELARALEATETAVAVESARILAARNPNAGAATLEVCGGVAIFAGASSPFSQALHLGMKGPVNPSELDLLEDFYRSRHTAVTISLCPLADASLVAAVSARGYRISHFEHTMCRWVGSQEAAVEEPAGSRVRAVLPEEAQAYARLTMLGFGEGREPQPEMLETFVHLFHAEGARAFWVEEQGGPRAAAGMSICGNVAMLYGDATLPQARGRGFQRALIGRRIRQASESGCYLAMACTLPGSISQRNYERAGFQVAYTKVLLIREWTADSAPSTKWIC